jgi:hypothetical protein
VASAGSDQLGHCYRGNRVHTLPSRHYSSSSNSVEDDDRHNPGNDQSSPKNVQGTLGTSVASPPQQFFSVSKDEERREEFKRRRLSEVRSV